MKHKADYHLLVLCRYNNVISACCLKQDLDIFPHGDATEVSISLVLCNFCFDLRKWGIGVVDQLRWNLNDVDVRRSKIQAHFALAKNESMYLSLSGKCGLMATAYGRMVYFDTASRVKWDLILYFLAGLPTVTARMFNILYLCVNLCNCCGIS